MSLTRKQLEDKAKPRFEVVEIEGFGKVGIRSCPQIQDARRYVSYQDPTTGTLIPEEQAKSGIHKLIDQVMVDENTPMFTDEDFDLIAGWNTSALLPLYSAIDKFNGDEPKNGSGGLKG